MRRRTVLMTAVVACGVVVALAAIGRTDPAASEPTSFPPIAGVSSELARVIHDPAARTAEVVIGPVALPGMTPGLRTPIQLVELPVHGALRGYSWRVTDAAGRALSNDLLHHVNLIDPDRRELFSPIARRVLAAGRETTAQSFPSLVGYPVTPSTRLLVVAMFANPAATPVSAAYLRVRLEYTPADRRVRPLAMFPFYLDVMGPVGEKSFAVPPGRTEQSWVGRPAVDARVLALGGHLHDHATSLTLADAETGKVLWRARPQLERGRLLDVPTDMLWRRGGLRLRADRSYRITVQYDNPTGVPTAHGGMGVIAGVATVRATWPAVDRQHPDYATDLARVIAAPSQAAAGHDHGQHVH